MALAKPYNPAAYVYGGASPAVAKAIQAQGYKYTAPKPYTPPAPQPPAAPPAAPPAPPSSQSSQAAAAYVPGEGIYAQDSAAAYDAFNAAVAGADKDAQSARAQYGFNAEGSNLDPSNSTGLFQRLMRTQAQTSDSDREDAIGRGLGGTGLGAQIGEQHDFQNQGDLADLTNGYQGMLAAVLAKKGDANTTLTNALLTARQNQLSYDLQNQMFTAFNQGGNDGTGTSPPPTTPPPVAPPPAQSIYYNPQTKKTTTYQPGRATGQMWMT
jgi:hypothetical protein